MLSSSDFSAILNLTQILMDELHSHRAFSNARRHALHRAMPHITNRKYSRNIGLQKKRISIKTPTLGTISGAYEIWPRKNEPALVAFDHIPQPVSLWQSTNENKDGVRGNALDLTGIGTKDGNLFHM